MSLLKTWKRRILRNSEKKIAHSGMFDRTWKSITTGLAGLGFLASAHCLSAQTVEISQIEALDTGKTFVQKITDANGNRFHITSQAVSGTNAFNSFTNLNLATGDTANFYLPNGTNNLINFIQTRIEIDGMVNAIKDNKIGGNLFFLSSQGLVLGSTGIVNCGALFAMTPTNEFMDKFIGTGNLQIDGNSAEIGHITGKKIVSHNGVVSGDGVPLNSDGSIIIAGRINAIDNVGAYAGSVTLQGTGRIDTGITDFSALVNTQDFMPQMPEGNQQGPSEVIVSGLTMTTNEDGNVELVAVANNLNRESSASTGSDGYTDYITADAEARVLIQGQVNAKRNASFEATAVNGTLTGKQTIVEYGETRELKTFVGADSIASTKAVVEIDATARINAENDVYLHAFATNIYKSSAGLFDLGLNLAGMLSPINIQAETAFLDSSAKVQVNKGAIVTAKKSIDVKSSSETDVIMGTGTSLAKIRQTSGIVSAGVVAAEVNSSSNIEVSGTLNAGLDGDATSGDITLNSLSSNALDATAASKTANDSAILATGIVIGKVSNDAGIKINSTAALNAKRNVNGEAKTRSDVSTQAIVETGDDSYGGMAINFTDFNSSARVEIAKGFTAPGNIDFSACDLVLQNRATAKGKVGYTKISQAIANLQTSLVERIFSLGKFTSKFTGPLDEEAMTKFRAAGAIVVNRGSHDANLKIGRGVKLDSGSELILKSSSVIEDIFTQADSVATSKLNNADGTKMSISAGLVYSDISQNSAVNVADAGYSETTGNGTVLTGKTVEISSEAKVEYNRITRVIQEIEDAVATLKISVTDENQLALINSVVAAYQNIKDKFSTIGSDGLTNPDNITYFLNALASLSTMSEALSQLVAGENLLIAKAAEIVTAGADFAFYNNFLNTAVSSAVKGANEEKMRDIGFSGAVGFNDYTAVSEVIIGRNTTIQSVNPATSVDESIKISAEADIDMIGAAGYLIPSSGSTAMGGTFFAQDFNPCSRVYIPEGANIIGGGKNVSISADTDADAIACGLSSAMAGAGIQGMFTFVSGDSEATVRIDDEVDFSLVKDLKLNSLNNTRIINVAGSAMISSSVGVSVGLAINNFVKDSSVFFGDTDNTYQNFLDERAGVDPTTTKNSKRTRTDAEVAVAGQMDAQAKSTGTFVAVGVAGGVTMNDDSGESGAFGKFKDKADAAQSKIANTINSVALFFSDITSQLSTKTDVKSTAQHTNPSISISAAGSGGLNFIENNTNVSLRTLKMEFDGDSGSNLNAIAVNNTDVWAFAGSAGIMFQTQKQGDSANKSVGIAGAVGLNSLNNTTTVMVKNNSITNADQVNVFAVNGGKIAAAGLGLQVSKNSGNADGAFTMGGSVSLNNIENTVNALLVGTDVTGTGALNTDVNVAAYEGDLQVTGGVQITVGQQKGAFGAAVNVSKINNDVTARVNGGNFNQIKDLNVSAIQAIAQINGAMTAGVVLGTSNSVSLMGAMIYNDLENNLTAEIINANINASGKVAVNSRDYLRGEDQTGFSQMLDQSDSGLSSFIDTDGSDYYDVDASNEADGEVATPLKDQIKKGSIIVSGAMAISVGDVAIGAGVSLNDIDNNFSAEINDSTINTGLGTVETDAKIDTFMVSAAGGVAVSTKNGAGGGSVIWNDVNSTVESGTTNSIITTGNYLSKAGNDSRLIGVAGQVSAGKGPAIGLTFAYNNIVNNSNAYCLGTKVVGPGSLLPDSSFIVNAANNGEIMNLAATVAVSDFLGIGGAVAVNRVSNNANALVDDRYTDNSDAVIVVPGVEIVDFNSFSAGANDKSAIKAIAGGFSFAGEAAVGGAVAYNEITGGTKTNLNNLTLGAENVQVKSVNDADIWTMAAGCGGAGEVAVQGAAVTSQISRDVVAAFSNVNENKPDSDIEILAKNIGEINSNATVGAIGGSVGVGAGVAVNRLNDTLLARIYGGSLAVKNVDIRSIANQTIRTIGVAGAGGAYAGVSGSNAVNMINNTTYATIGGNAGIVAEENIGVVAQSDEILLNYAGLATGGIAGVGEAVSVNSIDGITRALISNSSVQAKGLSTEGVSVKDVISDDKMNAGFIDDSTLNLKYTLDKKRTTREITGLVVDSSSTHTVKSFVANAAMGVGVAGTVNVSRIDGDTRAVILNSTINNGVNGGDVSVIAQDYTNLSGFVGSLGAGAAGVGLSSDSGVVKRAISARIDGILAGSSAKDVLVNSRSKLGISSIAAGLGISGAHSVAGTVSVNMLESNTEALVNNSLIDVNSLFVTSNHWAKTSIVDGTAAVGGYTGIGGAVGINKVKDIVKAEIADSTITMKSDGSGGLRVQAGNEMTLKTIGAAIGAGYAGLAGNVGVNFIETDVLASVKNSTMVNRAKNVFVKATDNVTIDSNLGTVGAGVVGAGISAGVNILDGKTRAIVDGSKLYAVNSINITADEARNITQNAFTAAAGAGAFAGNVIYISSGNLLIATDEDGASNVRDAVSAAEQMNSGNIGETNGALTDKEKAKLNADGGNLSSSEAGLAETSVSVGKIEATVGSTLDSLGDVNIGATEQINTSAIGGSGAIGAVAAGGSVSFVNVRRNAGTNLNEAIVKAGAAIAVNSATGGSVDLDMYQGSIGYWGAGTAAYGIITSGGKNYLNISSSNLNAKGDIAIKAEDSSISTAESYGLTAGEIAAGAIVTQIDNNALTRVTLTDNNIRTGNATSKISIEADRQNTLTAKSVGGALGLFVSGNGIASTVNENSSASINSTGGTFTSKNRISFDSSNAPKATSEATSASISGLVSAGVSVAKSNLSGAARISVSGEGTFNAPEVAFNAKIYGDNNLVAEGVSGGFAGSFGYNQSWAKNDSAVTVLIGDSNFTRKDTDLSLFGSNIANQNVETRGLNVGGLIASGNNKARAIADTVTRVELTGNSEIVKELGSLAVTADSASIHKIKADGNGGGLISADGLAAYAINKITSLTQALVSGKFNISNGLDLFAAQNDQVNINADSISAAVAGYSGTKSENTINSTTKTGIGDGSLIDAGSDIEIQAKNTINCNDDGEFAASGGGYGGIVVSGADSVAKITSTTETRIGKDSALASGGEITSEALTDATINNKVSINGAGMIANPLAQSTNTIAFSNSLVIDSGALLKTKSPGKDVNLAASDNLTAVLTSDADMQGGLGGYSEAKTDSEITKNNTLYVYGDIISANDANLYTDSDAQGRLVNFDLTVTADAYNKHSAVAVAKAEIDSKTTQNNKIRIYKNSDINAIRHIGLNATSGKMRMTEAASEYTWYSTTTTGGYASTASGVRSKNLTSGNAVILNGNLVSGVNNIVELTIDGLVDLLGQVPESTTSPTVTSTISEYASRVTTGMMDYGNELFTRYLEVCNLAAEYDGTVAGTGYLAEKNRILNEMEKYGLYDSTTGTVVGGLLIQYISLPAMVCSGGNVIINTDGVSGYGNIEAKGAPQINVINNSNLYMKVGDLNIADVGGELIYNSVSLGDNADTVLPTLTKIQTSDPASSLISVKETWDGDLTVVEDGVARNVTPITNIELNGNISNQSGRVLIENVSGDIIMQGAASGDGASISGREIELKASSGSISQGFSKGILNIGGTPEDVFGSYATLHETMIDGHETTSVSKNSFGNDIDERQQQGTWIAGNNIFISAMDINVNGLIQSGYSEYKVFLGSEARKKIEKFDHDYMGQNVTPDMLVAYKINSGGSRVDFDGTAVYEVQAFYNPQTKKIILEDIDPKGGKVYLTGRISSTGNGKILAIDGSADIDINNSTGCSLTVGKINVGNQSGLISITDIARGTTTEFRRDSTTTGIIGGNDWKVSGATPFYKPEEGTYYHWTTGKTVAEVEDYYKKVKFYLWGGFSKDASTIREYEITENLLNSGNGEKSKLPGTYIGTFAGGGVPGDPEYVIHYENDVDYFSSYFDKWITYSNAIKSRGYEHYKWGHTVGKTLTFQHSLKADHEIGIGFIGSRNPGGAILINSDQNLNLTGNLTGVAGTRIDISSQNGAIEQTGGNIIGDNLNFRALNGIGNSGAINHFAAGDKATINAVTINGDVDIFSKASSGKRGDLEVVKISTSGDVRLTADGTISRSNAGDSLVKGRRIDLTSNFGGIGQSGAAILIEGGQIPAASGDTMSASVNATANESIFLEQTSGDMRLGRIESRLGDVELTVNEGSFDNVLPAIDNSNERKGEDLVNKWIAIGLINADGTNTENAVKAEAVADYENRINNEFASYLAQKAFYDANPGNAKADSFMELLGRYGTYSSAQEYLTAQKSDSSSDYFKILNNEYGWTKDNLLYALQKSIMNPTSGSTTTIDRPANVKGKNITLTALNGGIGKDGEVEELSIADLSSNLDVLKKLAGAEAADITWKEAEGKATINNKTAIGIEMTSSSGGLTATAKDNVYIAASTDAPIYLKNIDAGAGNIRLFGRDGILNVTTVKDSINLIGKDLIIEGGDKSSSSSIGTSNKAIVTGLSGTLTARAEGYINIYQKSLNPLLISALYGGGHVYLRSFSNLNSVYSGSTVDDSGYLNVDGRLTLVSDFGNIGQDGEGVRVLLDNLDLIRATGKNVYLEILSGSAEKPALNVGTINAGDAGVFKLRGDVSTINFNGVIDADNIDVVADTLIQNEENSAVKTENFKAVTTDGISLDSAKNKIQRASLTNQNGSIYLKNIGDLRLMSLFNGSTADSDGIFVDTTGILTFARGVNAKNIGVNALKVNQNIDRSRLLTENLTIKAEQGIYLNSMNNEITQASLFNRSSGNVEIGAKTRLRLLDVINLSEESSSAIKINGQEGINFSGLAQSKNIDVKSDSVSQQAKISSIVTDNLSVETKKGMSFDSGTNRIAMATLKNTGKNNILLRSQTDLEVAGAINDSTATLKLLKINCEGKVALTGMVKGENVEILADSISQENDSGIVTPDLIIKTSNGMSINSNDNQIAKAVLTNASQGNIVLKNGSALELFDVINYSRSATSKISLNNSGNVTLNGLINARNINITAESLVQNEVNSQVKTKDLRVRTISGVSLDSSINKVAQVTINNEQGNVIFRNKYRLDVNKIVSGGDVKLANTGLTSASGEIIGENVTMNFYGTFNSQSNVVARKDLSINATGEIIADTIRGKNVRLASGLAKSSFTLNVLENAIRNTRINLVPDLTDEAAGTTETVNEIAIFGGINVHNLIAEEEIRGHTATGDIMVANISGKKVVLKVDQNEGKVSLDRAELGETLDVAASEFKSKKIEHTQNSDDLQLTFSSVGGEYMKEVSIDMISSEKGVRVDDLNSIVATINSDCSELTLKDVNLLAVGQFSNNDNSVVIAGSENYSSDVKISGSGIAIQKHETRRAKQSASEEIAGFIKHTKEAMKRNLEPNNDRNEFTEKLIDSGMANDLNEPKINLIAENGQIFLASSDENDESEGIEEVAEKENTETENND